MISPVSASTSNPMQKLFAEWPVSVPRKGLVVTVHGEQIQFVEFMITGELLLLERQTPDLSGARRVIIDFNNIAATKILDAVEMSRFTAFGFRGAAGVR
ncbi:MAG: hypothetical protein GY758_20900 [Fuerstiella sp.]|jgi:hypothetical protein|nr:hypothetical protein [Fuerstiella sp.]MCP4508272.1 hypothetical protein [Fuerstiella sp.]MDG2127939.1 hypothetical protein [Fuerstiella sp.]